MKGGLFSDLSTVLADSTIDMDTLIKQIITFLVNNVEEVDARKLIDAVTPLRKTNTNYTVEGEFTLISTLQLFV
jgi:hypothetical protein